MVLEVTSRDSETNRRIRHAKRDGYAAAGIPVFLLIDRDRQTLTLYSEPEGGTYRLDTEALKGFAAWLTSRSSGPRRRSGGGGRRRRG